jgi:hypothetical protein
VVKSDALLLGDAFGVGTALLEPVAGEVRVGEGIEEKISEREGDVDDRVGVRMKLCSSVEVRRKQRPGLKKT